MLTKKLVSAGLAIATVASLFTGCSGGGTTASNAASGAESGAAANTEPQRMVLLYPFQTVTSTTDYIEKVRGKLQEKMAEDSLYIDLDWIIIPRDNFDEKKNTLLASGDQLDGLVGDTDDFWGDVMKPGLVRPIDDLVDQYAPNLKKLIPERTWTEVRNVKGEICAIPSYSREYWNGTVIRKDWLDEAGLEMPQTIEELEAAMEAFKKRPNVIPAGGKPWFMESHLASAVSGGVTAENGWETVSPEGEFIQAYEHPNYVKFLEMYNKWISSGWYDPDFLVTDDTDYESMLYTGRMGIYFCDPKTIEKYIPLVQAQDPKAVLEVAPVFSGPMGEAALQENAGVRYVTYLTTYSKQPELVVKYLDWLVSDPENYRLARYGIEGENYVLEDGDKWRSPDSTGGDDNKRGYEDVFAPLEFEALKLDRKTQYYDLEKLHDYYAGLPTYTHPLTTETSKFIIDWDAVGNFNSLDIWTEMFNISAGARPISDWQKVVDDYEASVTEPYAKIRAQYKEWKAKNPG